jgi:hypothetical protein
LFSLSCNAVAGALKAIQKQLRFCHQDDGWLIFSLNSNESLKNVIEGSGCATKERSMDNDLPLDAMPNSISRDKAFSAMKKAGHA